MTDQKANIADELRASLEEGIQILEGTLPPRRMWTSPADLEACQDASAVDLRKRPLPTLRGGGRAVSDTGARRLVLTPSVINTDFLELLRKLPTI